MEGEEGRERTRTGKNGDEGKYEQDGETTETRENIEASFITGPPRIEIKAS